MVPDPLEVPIVPGVTWNFEQHSGFLFIVPKIRWVDSDEGAGSFEGADWLAYSRDRASGNFVTLNSTFSSIVTRALLLKIEAK